LFLFLAKDIKETTRFQIFSSGADETVSAVRAQI